MSQRYRNAFRDVLCGGHGHRNCLDFLLNFTPKRLFRAWKQRSTSSRGRSFTTLTSSLISAHTTIRSDSINSVTNKIYSKNNLQSLLYLVLPIIGIHLLIFSIIVNYSVNYLLMFPSIICNYLLLIFPLIICNLLLFVCNILLICPLILLHQLFVIC